MSSSRPGPLFVGIMSACLASAFVVPARFTAAVRSPLQGLFWPVSRPVRAIAGAAYRRVHTGPVDVASPDAPRPATAVYAENAALRADFAALSVKFDQLSRLNADRQLVGNIRDRCRPATVTGTDPSGLRDVLLVSGIGASAVGRPVVHGSDFVGVVQAAGLTGGSVRLVTDPGFAFTAEVLRYTTDAEGRVSLVRLDPLRPVVRGMGHGTMSIRTVTMAQAGQLQLAAGDVVVLADPEMPGNVQGLTAGRVAAVHPQANAPMFADVRVEPMDNLMSLKEVMVVVRD